MAFFLCRGFRNATAEKRRIYLLFLVFVSPICTMFDPMYEFMGYMAKMTVLTLFLFTEFWSITVQNNDLGALRKHSINVFSQLQSKRPAFFGNLAIYNCMKMGCCKWCQGVYRFTQLVSDIHEKWMIWATYNCIIVRYTGTIALGFSGFVNLITHDNRQHVELVNMHQITGYLLDDDPDVVGTLSICLSVWIRLEPCFIVHWWYSLVAYCWLTEGLSWDGL